MQRIVAFIVIAVICAALGFGAAPIAATGIAQVLCSIFVMMALVSVLLRFVRYRD